MKHVILTDAAPAPVGPYSQAIRAGDWLFVSGQIPMHPRTGELAGQDVALQTRRALDNLAAVLAAAGAGMKDVVKVTVYMADLAQFAAMNVVYEEYFGEAPPARACVEVAALPKGSLVEIECIAGIPS